MANEEIRGEVQDTRLIGLSAPGPTSGLASSLAQSNPAAPSGTAVPALGLSVKSVYDVLPIFAQGINMPAFNLSVAMLPGSQRVLVSNSIVANGFAPFQQAPDNGLFQVPLGKVFVPRRIKGLITNSTTGALYREGNTAAASYAYLSFVINGVDVPFSQILSGEVDSNIFFIVNENESFDIALNLTQPEVAGEFIDFRLDITGDFLLSRGLQKEYEVAL